MRTIATIGITFAAAICIFAVVGMLNFINALLPTYGIPLFMFICFAVYVYHKLGDSPDFKDKK